MSEEEFPPLMEFIFDTTRTIIYMSQKNVFSSIRILSGLYLIVVLYSYNRTTRSDGQQDV